MLLRALGLAAALSLATAEQITKTVTQTGHSSALGATGEASAQGAEGSGTDQVGAEYVVHPDIHPLERIKGWGEQIEINNGTNAFDYMNRGVAYTEQATNEETDPKLIEQRLQEADADYRKSLEINPANAPTHYNLGNPLRKKSR